MEKTFLVTVDLPDDIDLDVAAEDIHEAVEDQFDVKEVKPWAEHNPSITQLGDLARHFTG